MNSRLLKYLMFIVIISQSCHSKLENSISTTFYTQDSVYKITFDKPLELDTFYTWTDWDDNGCSDERKYRFSKKGFPAQRETGFFWSSFADSTYRITLKHVEGFDCKSSLDNEEKLDAKEYLNRQIEKSKRDNPKVNIDTIFSKNIKINGQDYALSSYKIKEDYYLTKDYSNGYWTHYLKAFTEKDGNYLVFTADCRTKNCVGFIQRMEQSFNSIKIEKSPKIFPPCHVLSP